MSFGNVRCQAPNKSYIYKSEQVCFFAENFIQCIHLRAGNFHEKILQYETHANSSVSLYPICRRA